MAVTITDQPTANTWHSSEYPLTIQASSDLASVKYLRFTIQDSNTTGLGIPAYFAPQIGGYFTFNVSDYINHYLTIDRDDFVSFDATPTLHNYTNLTKDILVNIREVDDQGALQAQTDTNAFFMAKFKHQVYNGLGTAMEYVHNRYFLTSLPYFKPNIQGDPTYFSLQDGRTIIQEANDYARVSFVYEVLGSTPDRTSVTFKAWPSLNDALNNTNSLAGATMGASEFSGQVNDNTIISLPVNPSDINSISAAGWTGLTLSQVEAQYKIITVDIGDTSDQTSSRQFFAKPNTQGKRCNKTFIYMNRFGVHEALTLGTKQNVNIISTRDNTTLVNSGDPLDANTNDLGRYLLTGARQVSINPRSEREFKVTNTLPYPPEQNEEIMLDFFASPVHYVVDEADVFPTSVDISHPDTGTEKVRRIIINGGTASAIRNNRSEALTFSYRYADV